MPKGTGVSPGIGLAQAMLWPQPVTYDYIPRTCASPAHEVDRFEAARRSLHGKTRALRQKTARIMGDEEAAIFDAYSMILDDEDGLLEPLRKKIRLEACSAEYAVTTQLAELARTFMALDDEYMRQRVDDVFAIRDLLMRELMGQMAGELPALEHSVILIASILSPGDIANLSTAAVAGVVCEEGGYSSHTAILARTLGIPAILGAAKITETVQSGALLAIDGETGEIWVEPCEKELSMLRRRAEALSQRNQAAQSFRGLPTISADGRRVELSAAISSLEELDTVLQSDAESLGLFRTERLHFAHGGFPGEEEQYTAYCTLLARMEGKTVTMRTFDSGGARMPAEHKLLLQSEEANPVLGRRGLRLCLSRPSFFRCHLRALLRASARGPMRIMFPMVATPDELDEALFALDTIKQELRREKTPFDENIPVGVYMAIPSAALSASVFAQRVDFVTISMADLLQFTLAVDRSSQVLSGLYHMFHPSLFHGLHHILQGVHAQGKPCYIAGEAPGYEQCLPALMGLGPDGLCVNPNILLHCRQILSRCLFEDCQALTQEILQMTSSRELAKKLDADTGLL